jgi:hypothetical protein
MCVRVGPSMAAIVPWKVASVGVGRPGVGDAGAPGKVQEGEPEGAAVIVPAGFGVAAGPDEQDPPTKVAARQTATVRTQDRLRFMKVSVDRSGNSVVSSA